MDSNGTTTARKTQHRVHSPACLPSARLAARKTSGRASDLPKTPCANRRRRRSQIPGWAQGVKGHPRLVPKRSKESRKASNALQTGPRKANDATKSDTVRAPPVIRRRATTVPHSWSSISSDVYTSCQQAENYSHPSELSNRTR